MPGALSVSLTAPTLPLWVRSLAWSASYVGAGPEPVSSALEPGLREGARSYITALSTGDANERVASLLRARRAWTAFDALQEGRHDPALGAQVVASVIAGLPGSARSGVARALDASSLDAVAAVRSAARPCDPWALSRGLDRLALISRGPLTVAMVGALARGGLGHDLSVPAAVERTLRSLRAVGLAPRALFEPFASLLIALRDAEVGP